MGEQRPIGLQKGRLAPAKSLLFTVLSPRNGGNQMRMRRTIQLVVAVLVTMIGQSQAALLQVPIDGHANSNLRAYTNGGVYPIAPTTITVGAVPFDLAPLAGSANSLGIIQSPSTGIDVTIAADVVGATKVYTLINSAFGSFGSTNGRLEFTGTGGATATYNLVQGFNIRDHYNDGFNNVVNDPTVVTRSFGGGVRLDRQTFVLPSVFSGETLTGIRFVGYASPGLSGRPFLAAMTIENAPAPEPTTLAIWGMFGGLGLIAARRRRKV